MRPATGVLAQRHGDDLKAAWQVIQYSTKCKAHRRKVRVCHDGVMCVVRGLRVLHKAQALYFYSCPKHSLGGLTSSYYV